MIYMHMLNGHDSEKTDLSMKVLSVSLSPNPSPAGGEGSIEKSLRNFHVNRGPMGVISPLDRLPR